MCRPKEPGFAFVIVAANLFAASAATGQGPIAVPASESRTAWEWYQEVHLPLKPGKANTFDFVLTPSVFDKARPDLNDLRLFDGSGREIPFKVQVRRDRNIQEPLSAREFNRAQNADRSTEISLDLGDGHGEHNEIDIVSNGNDFRRRVRVEGGDSEKNWSLLLDKAFLVRFRQAGTEIDVHRLRYPPSRFRYLRVRVFPESGNDDDRPVITSVAVFRSIQVPAEYATLPAFLGAREADRVDRTQGSVWTIQLTGESAWCEKLTFETQDREFVRAFRLELLEPGEGPRTLAQGEWRRRDEGNPRPLEITFPEVLARSFRLLVTDYRNPSLNLTSVRYTAPVRRVVFARPDLQEPPYRLYFGNPKAANPQYDFARNLPELLEPTPARGELVPPALKNPDYKPLPKPWTERWPWLVYVVLALACLVLLAILTVLARTAITRSDAKERAETLNA